MRSNVVACTLPQLHRACMPMQVFPFFRVCFLPHSVLGVECAIGCGCVRPAAARAYVPRNAFTFFRRVSNVRSCAAVCLRHSCAAHVSPVRCATEQYHFAFLYIWM